jgi:hypothetical protein
MTPQERDLTTILLDRLNKTEDQPKDPEAETLIRETTAMRTDAPYSLLQTVLIQDLSLHNAQNRITDLEMQPTETKRASSAPPSFLAAAFGSGEPSGGVRTSNVPQAGPGTGPSLLARTAPPGYVPEGGSAVSPAPGAGSPGGDFLRSAARTAAGIAGGALLFEGIKTMFGQHDAVGIAGNQPAAPGLGETLLNNHWLTETSVSVGGSTDEHAGAGYGPEICGSDTLPPTPCQERVK